MSATVRRVQEQLDVAGFDPGPIDGVYGHRTARAVGLFQRAYARGRDGTGAFLDVDGIPGPLTQRALSGLPWLSPHFRVDEFQSKGDGTCRVHRGLLEALEDLRLALGSRPLVIRSGYRDPAHNARVGGASRSQHLYGLAADLDYPCSLDFAREVGVFSGLGHKGGALRHVDVRHLVQDTNPTRHATPGAPAVWAY